MQTRALLTRAARITGTSLSLLAGAATPVLAQVPNRIENPSITTRWGRDYSKAVRGELFTEIFIHIWQILITVGGLLTLVFFLWGAIEWITAGGDSAKVGKARDRITQAVIGLFLLVTSFVLVEFIGTLLFGGNFSILELTFPTAKPCVPTPPFATC